MRLIHEFIPVLKIVLNPLNWLKFFKSLIKLPHTIKSIYSFIIFFVILVFYVRKSVWTAHKDTTN